MNTGRCLCGQVSYVFDAEQAGLALNCHCKDCQRITGSGKATVVSFPEQSIAITGQYKTYANRGTDGSHVNRGFCPNCGSQMFTFVEELPGQVFVKAGTMDDSQWVQVALNCWVSSASVWSPPDASIPGIEENPQDI